MAETTTDAEPAAEAVVAPADCYLVAIGTHVAAGETVEVDVATAASLRAQGWTTPTPGTKKAPAPALKAAVAK